MIPRFLQFLPLVFLAACSPQDSTATAPATAPATTDAASIAPTPPIPVATAPRVISLGPALTLITTQVDAADTLVGVSTYDKLLLPPDKQDLPVVGDYMTLNYELLQKLAPTALLLQKSEDRIEPQLRTYCSDHHVTIVNARLDTIDDIFATARRIGAATGKLQHAENQIALTQLKIVRLRQRLAHATRPKVLYITGTNPIFVVGAERFMNDMITIAGGDNVGATIKKDFPEVTREMILQLKPEVILLAAPDEPAQRSNDPRLKEWAELPTPAAADGRLYLVTDPNGEMPSLAIADSAKFLAHLIHPEIDLDAPLPPAPVPDGAHP